MRKLYWHIAGRFNEVRASRALAAYFAHTQKAAKYFARLSQSDKSED